MIWQKPCKSQRTSVVDSLSKFDNDLNVSIWTLKNIIRLRTHIS